jgi:hypothetical protein
MITCIGKSGCVRSTGATWLNLVERFFAAITEKQKANPAWSAP